MMVGQETGAPAAVTLPEKRSRSWPLPALGANERRLLLSLLTPLALGFFFSRLWKVISVALVMEAAAGRPVRRFWIQLLLALAALGVVALSRNRATRALAKLGLSWRAVGVGLAALSFLVVVSSRVTGHVGGFLDRWAGRLLLPLHVFRGDFFFVLGFALIALGALSLRPLKLRACCIAGLHVLVAGMLILAGLDLAYFRETGLNGDVFTVRFVLGDVGSLEFLLRNGVNWGNVAIVTGYAALLPGCVWCLGRTRWGKPLADVAISERRASLVSLALALAVWAAPQHYLFNFQYQQVSGQLHAALLGDLLTLQSASAAQRVPPKTKIEPLADWRQLAFTPGPRTQRLNVAIIILESTRARSVTPYNSELPSTPFLASLASRGLLVDDMNAVIPQTSKAWTAVLTGLHPVTSTLTNWSFAGNGTRDLPSLPSLLRPHGYVSAFFTPAHLRFDHDLSLVRARGFDLIRSDGDYDTTGFERTNYYGFEDRILLRPTLAWVDRVREQGKPFFLTLMTLTGHHDYKVPSTFTKHSFATGDDSELNDYLNTLRYVDGFLRDLFAGFEERGLLDSTLFIIVGDHGQSFGEHGARQHHGVLFDEALRIPGLLYAPHLWSGPGRISGPRQQIDVLPTIADALGFELTGGHMPGSSLLRPVPEDRTLFFMDWHDDTHLALRRGSRKFIYTFSGSLLQAFDLKSDPMELHDVAPLLSQTEADAVESEIFTYQARVNKTVLSSLNGRD